MSRSVAVIAVLVCFAAAILTACGSSNSGGSSTADNAAATNAETTAPAATKTETTAPAASTTSKSTTPDEDAPATVPCHKAYDPLVAQFRKLDRVTDETPSFATYRAATNKLMAVNGKSKDLSRTTARCSTAVGGPVTKAFLAHITAMQFWTDCRKRQDCAEVMPKIKAQWRDASKAVDAISKGFKSVTTT